MISTWCFSSSMRQAQLARQLRHLVVVQQAQVLGDDLLGRRALEVQVLDLQRQALLQVARGDADRVEALNQRAAPSSTSSTGHGPIDAISSTDATR